MRINLTNSASRIAIAQAAAGLLGGKDEDVASKGHIVNVGTVEERTKHFAEMLNADEGFSGDIEALSDANENTKRGPFLILWDIRSILGAETDNLPVPGSERGKVNNYDYYPKDPSKEMKGPNKGSFYNDLFDLLSVGAAIKAKLEAIKNDDAMSDIAKAELSGKLKARQTYGRNVLNKAVRLQFQGEAIAELSADGVYLAELTDMDGDKAIPRATPKPFRLDNVNSREEFRLLSVDQVLNLEPAKARDLFKKAEGKVSMWKCLLETLKNTDKATTSTPGQNAPAIDTVAKFGDYIAEVVAYSNKLNENAALNSGWIKEVLKPENKDLRENVAVAANFLGTLCENKDFVRLYRADQNGSNTDAATAA